MCNHHLTDVDAVDVALSGGGFRATLFHLGVVGFLRDSDLLMLVKNICSVSGGSILAAHMVSHWDEYESEIGFRNRATELVNWIMANDVSGTILRHSKNRILEGLPLDSELLAVEYRTLLGTRRWDDFDGAITPELHVLATHLNTGRAGAYSSNGFRLPRAQAHERHATEINAFADFAAAHSTRHQEIARAVAASSAFPPVFSPIPLVPGDPTHVLTDGGVFDNGGVNYLKDLYSAGQLSNGRGRLVVISNAGRDFPTSLGSTYDSFLALALRVTDTQGNRIAEADTNGALQFFAEKNVRVLRPSIHDVVTFFEKRPSNHSERVQELLGMVRTELDAFSTAEVLGLYQHGYLSAQQSLAQLLTTSDETFPLGGVEWSPIDARSQGPSEATSLANKDVLENALKNSHILKKQAALKKSLPCMAFKWILNRYGARLAVAAITLFGVGLIVYSSIQSIRNNWSAQRVPVGRIRVVEVRKYDSEGWAASIPAINPLFRSPVPRPAYTFTTEPIGKLTSWQPHGRTAARITTTGPFEKAEVYLFLRQSPSSEEAHYEVANDLPPDRLQLPSGSAHDEVVGVIISDEHVDDVWAASKYIQIDLGNP